MSSSIPLFRTPSFAGRLLASAALIFASGPLWANPATDSPRKIKGDLSNIRTEAVLARMMGWREFTPANPQGEPRFYTQASLGGKSNWKEHWVDAICDSSLSHDTLWIYDNDELVAASFTIHAVDEGAPNPNGGAFDIGNAYHANTPYYTITQPFDACGGPTSWTYDIDNQTKLNNWAREIVSPTRKQWMDKARYDYYINYYATDPRAIGTLTDLSTAQALEFNIVAEMGYECGTEWNICANDWVEHTDYDAHFVDDTSVQLSVRDTEKQALLEARSSTSLLPFYDWRYGRALRTRRTSTDPRVFNNITTKVDAKFFGLCPGLYEIKIRLMRSHTSDPDVPVPTPPVGGVPAGDFPDGYKTITLTHYFSEKDQQADGSFVYPDFKIEPYLGNLLPDDPEGYEGEDYFFTPVAVFETEPGLGEVVAIPMDDCASCGGSNQAGHGSVENGCVKVQINLGSGVDGLSGSLLRLESDDVAAVTSPNALELLTGGEYPARQLRVSGALRQVIASDVIVDILPVSGGYEMSFYRTSQAQAGASTDDPYTFTGNRFAVWRIVRPADSGNNRYLQVTRGESGSAVHYLFTQGTQGTSSLLDDSWSLDEGGVRINTETLGAAPGGDRYVTTTLSDTTYGAASVRRLRLHTFSWGESIVEETLDPAGVQPLTTSYTYHLSGPEIGLRHTTTGPNGVVETQTYSSETSVLGGTVVNPLETITSYPGGRSRTVTYEALPDRSEDSDTSDETLVTTTETLGSEVVSRSWDLTFSSATTFAGETWQEHRSIQAASSGAAWSASANLVTTTRRRSTLAGILELVHSPDGTLSRTFYGGPDTNGFATTTREEGQPGTSGTTVVAGTRTSEVVDSSKRLVSRTVVDIASGLTLSDEDVLNFDAFGQPTTISYLDGSTETHTYSSCCGRLESSSRYGLTVTYTYDPLGRLRTTTEAGGVLRQTRDAADRVRLTERYPASAPTSILTVSTATYDPAGRMTASTDGRDRLTTQVQTVTPATGVTTTVTNLPYDSAWPVGDRGTVTRTQRADGLPLAVTGNASQPVRYVYGTETLSDAGDWGYGSGDQFEYTLEIKLDSTGADTSETIKTYRDFFGRTIKTLYADGAASRRFYNALGQLVRQTDPDGVQTLYAYDAQGERTVTAVDLDAPGTSGRGVINESGLDRITRTQSSVTTRNSIPVRRTITEVWADNNANTPLAVTTVDAAANGLQTWQTSHDQTTHHQIVYNASTGGRTETTTAPDNSSVVRTYLAGRLVSEEHKDGATTPNLLTQVSFAYDSYGRLQTRNQSGVGATVYSYYSDDQLLSVTTPDPDTSRSGSGYDPQVTAYHYDAAGRVDDVTLPDGTHTYTTYWPSGNVKRSSGSRTYPSDYTYDAQGRTKTLTTWKDFAGTSGSAQTTWTYHPQRGWLSSKTYAGGVTGPSYEYWPSGRLKTRTWARGITTTYTYNSAGDLWTVVYSGASPATPSVTTTYDRLGRPDTVADAAGTLTRGYSEGRLGDESYSTGLLAGRSIYRNLDIYNRLNTLTTDFSTLTYGYDAAGRLQTIGSWNVNHESHIATLGYKPMVGTVESVSISANGTTGFNSTRYTDQLGRVSSLVIGNASSSLGSRTYTYNAANQRTLVEQEDALRWAYGYDALGQVTSASKRQASGAALPGYDFGFTFDDIGNRKSATVNGRQATYTSDALNRYLSRSTPLFADVLGNATAGAGVLVNDELATRTGTHFYRSVPVVAQAANAIKIQAAIASPQQAATENRSVLIPAAPEAFSYDADGNLLQDGLWTYTWDGENRLVSQELRTDIATTTFKRLEFAYDGQGRRIQKIVKTRPNPSASWTTGSDTRFLYDAWNLIAEYDGLASFALVRGHVWGPDLSGTAQGAGGVGGLLWTSIVPTSKTYAAASDANGNVFAYVDLSNGTVAGQRDYGAFGEAVLTTGVSGNLPFGFSTKYEDKDSGLYYYGYRYYNPSTGRWLSRDPSEERGGINLYALGSNSPINEWDYLGLWKQIVCNEPEKTKALTEAYELALRRYNEAYDNFANWRQSRAQELYPNAFKPKPGVPNPTNLYEIFFMRLFRGVTSVRAKLRSREVIADACHDPDKKCSSGRDVIAYTTFDGNRVWICPLFFEQDADARAGTVAHELSHIAINSQDFVDWKQDDWSVIATDAYFYGDIAHDGLDGAMQFAFSFFDTMPGIISQ